MKNSAWYNKLWQKKLKELPLQGDPDKAWAGMRKILDRQMPAGHTLGPEKGDSNPFRPLTSRMTSLLGYTLPAAAMICLAVYFMVKPADIKKHKAKQHPQVISDSLAKESFQEHKTYMPGPVHKYDLTDKILSADKKDTLPYSLRPENSQVKASDQEMYLNTAVNTDTEPVLDTLAMPYSNSYAHFQRQALNYKEITSLNIKNLRLSSVPTGDTATGSRNITLPLRKSQRRNVKNAGSKIPEPNRAVQSKKPDLVTRFNYGIKAGYSFNTISNNMFFGAFSSFEISKYWYFNPELIVNGGKTLSGSYLHPSYFRPDSISPFSIGDSRKIYVVDLPLNIKYRISKAIYLSTGPVFSIPVKQTTIRSEVEYVPDPLDTMHHTKDINAALSRTVVKPEFNAGISAGMMIRLNRFNIEARYQQGFIPYKVSSGLGRYQVNSHSFLFAVGFHLNKGRPE